MGGKKSKPEPVKDFEKAWREVDWNSKEALKSELLEFQLNHPEINQLRILVYGPVGAGKSCFINSTMSVFKERVVTKAEEESSAGKSCSKTYRTYKITDAKSFTLPFVLMDVMGLEEQDESGVPPEDVIMVLKGHVKEGYKFNPVSPLNEGDPNFITNPGPNDRVHCLVSVMPADSISHISNEIVQKMTKVRKAALAMEIPHVVLMTKIDVLCPTLKEDLCEVYKSRKIKQKMEECSQRLGPPMKCIFPVSNYYEKNETNFKKDVLILMALKEMETLVKDHVEHDNN